MDRKTFEHELAKDLAEMQSVISELGGKEEFIAAGFKQRAEKKFKELIELTIKLTGKYKGAPLKMSGFSITLGAVLVNSSATVNFEF